MREPLEMGFEIERCIRIHYDRFKGNNRKGCRTSDPENVFAPLVVLVHQPGSAANRSLESEWRAPGAVNARGMPRAFAASRMYVLKAPQKTQRDAWVVSVG